MLRFKSFLRHRPGLLRGLAGGMAVAVFAWIAAQFYLPGQGFTYLLMFGQKEDARYLPELRKVNHYEFANSHGYDAQYYAQIAMRPDLRDPALAKAVDSLPYRARRILFCWTAWALAGGHPVGALYVYSVQNLLCWLILAGVLLHWLPWSDWNHLFRWGAVMFSFGLMFSVSRSLVDGPSLLLIALGLWLVERGRSGWGAVVLGVSGLGKETNLLAATALPWPDPRTGRGWAAFVGRGALVVLPLGLWSLGLRLFLGDAGDTGARNFAAPFAGFVDKFQDSVAQYLAEGFASEAKYNLVVLVGLLAQFLFFVLRPQWKNPWWRLGATYALLMVFLGAAVWEGYPSAAARVLLPMTLAFNVLVPRGAKWMCWLLIGNLGVIGSVDLLKPPGWEASRIEGPRGLRVDPDDGRTVTVRYEGRWFPPEKSHFEFWVWCGGPGSVAIHDPHPFAIDAEVRFGLRSNDSRAVTVRLGERVLWQGMLQPKQRVDVDLAHLTLPAGGDAILGFDSDRMAAYPGNGDMRRLTFSLRDLEVRLLERSTHP